MEIFRGESHIHHPNNSCVMTYILTILDNINLLDVFDFRNIFLI